MLPIEKRELRAMLSMLGWLDDHKNEFSDLLELPASLGADVMDTDAWGMVLLDLVGEQFGISASEGALERWDKAKVETINECVEDGDFHGCVRIENINRRVYELLSDIPF